MKTILTITAITAAAWGLASCDNANRPGGSTETTAITPSTTISKPIVGTDTTRTVGAAFDDAKIVTAVNAELIKDSELSTFKINVDSKNGNVLLKGTAPSKEAKNRAESLAKGAKDVVSVDNQLIIGSSGNLTNNNTLNNAKDSVVQGSDKVKNKIDDAAINVSINSKLAADNELNSINVDINDGNILLKGIAANSAAKSRATDLAKQVNGVISVDNQIIVSTK